MANTYYELIIYDKNGKEIHFAGGNDIYNSQEEAIKWAYENGYDNYEIKPIVTYNHYTVYYYMTPRGYVSATHPRMNVHILKAESDKLIESTIGVDNSIGRIKVCFTNEDLDVTDNEAIDAYARKILDDHQLTKKITRKQYEDLGAYDLLREALIYETEHKDENIEVVYFTSDSMYHVLRRIK